MQKKGGHRRQPEDAVEIRQDYKQTKCKQHLNQFSSPYEENTTFFFITKNFIITHREKNRKQ